MLGFRALVERNAEEIETLNAVYRSSGHDEFEPPTTVLLGEALPSEPAPNDLAYQFTHFHRALNATREHLAASQFGCVLIFSDSAFFQVDSLEAAMQLSASLMRSLLTAMVPARMGIGHGSVRLLRFLTDHSEQVTMHSSQFLGTAVVRAYAAEQSGTKGMRILLHRSVDHELCGDLLREVVPVTDKPETSCVTHEVNYLVHAADDDGRFDEFEFGPVKQMLRRAEVDVQFQYFDTLRALNRMRAALGRQPYDLDEYLDY